MTERHVVRLTWGLATLVALGSVAAGLGASSPTVVGAGPVLASIVAIEWLGHRRRAARREQARRLPGDVDRLIQQLRAGCSLRQGCERLGSDARATPDSALAPLYAGLAARRTLVEATDDLTRAADPGVRLLAVTLGVLAATGGPAVPALQRLRHTLVGVVNGRLRAEAEASQALASAGLLAAAPGLFVVLLAAVERSAAHLYLVEPIGAACLIGAIVLSYGGWRWMQRVLSQLEQRSR